MEYKNRSTHCTLCGSKLEPAGSSNQIDGRRFNGRTKDADKEWLVCPNHFTQNLETGDWQHSIN